MPICLWCSFYHLSSLAASSPSLRANCHDLCQRNCDESPDRCNTGLPDSARLCQQRQTSQQGGRAGQREFEGKMAVWIVPESKCNKYCAVFVRYENSPIIRIPNLAWVRAIFLCFLSQRICSSALLTELVRGADFLLCHTVLFLTMHNLEKCKEWSQKLNGQNQHGRLVHWFPLAMATAVNTQLMSPRSLSRQQNWCMAHGNMFFSQENEKKKTVKITFAEFEFRVWFKFINIYICWLVVLQNLIQ